jgi:hypothetical protein
MLNLGTTELIIVLLLIAIIITPLCVTIFLRKKYPNKRRLGIFIAFIFVPIGQFYLEGAIIYIIGLFIVHAIMATTFDQPVMIWICTGILSSLLMNYRFDKTESTKEI